MISTNQLTESKWAGLIAVTSFVSYSLGCRASELTGRTHRGKVRNATALDGAVAMATTTRLRRSVVFKLTEPKLETVSVQDQSIRFQLYLRGKCYLHQRPRPRQHRSALIG